MTRLSVIAVLMGVGCEDAGMFAKEPAVSLAAAVQAAEEHEGGTALDAELDDDSATPFYEVSVVRDGVVHDVFVDAETRTVEGSVPGDDGHDNVALLDEAVLTLVEAIEAAVDAKGGYATSADLDRAGPHASFEVEVVTQLRSIDLQVDATTGEVTQPKDD